MLLVTPAKTSAGMRLIEFEPFRRVCGNGLCSKNTINYTEIRVANSYISLTSARRSAQSQLLGYRSIFDLHIYRGRTVIKLNMAIQCGFSYTGWVFNY